MPEVTQISAAQLKALQATGNVLILDVRSKAEVEKSGLVPGAVHMPAIEVQKKSRPSSVEFDPAFDKAKTIVVYCAIGARSSAVADMLVKQGYADVRDFSKFSNWTDAGFPVQSA